jgi:hypothetical protein
MSWALRRERGDLRGVGFDRPGLFLRVGLVAAAIDLVTFTALARRAPRADVAHLAAAKLAGVGAAAVARSVLWRAVLFPDVREGQARRNSQVLEAGGVRLSIVVPAYREAERIGDTIRRLRAATAEVGPVEVIVVDDGSDDGTAAAAAKAGADRVIEQPANRGKGAAVRAGVLAATGRTIAFTDADLAYPPEQLLRLLAEVEDGWDVVVGSRRHVETTTLVRARRLREVSGRLFNLLTLLVLLGQYRDTQCGLKAFRGDVAHLLFSQARIDGFAFDVELFHLAERHRLSLREVPVALANTATSTVQVGVDAIRMVRDLLRIRRYASTGVYDPPRTPERASTRH